MTQTINIKVNVADLDNEFNIALLALDDYENTLDKFKKAVDSGIISEDKAVEALNKIRLAQLPKSNILSKHDVNKMTTHEITNCYGFDEDGCFHHAISGKNAWMNPDILNLFSE